MAWIWGVLDGCGPPALCGDRQEARKRLRAACCGLRQEWHNAICEVVVAKEDYEGRLFDRDYAHAAAVARRLTANWAQTDRIVVGDSYFASVGTAEALEQAGLRFIGCVKNATVGSPMKKLAETEATGRGFAEALTCRRVGRKDLIALMFVDRDCKHFISTAVTSRIAETAYRPRWRMIDGVGSEKIMTKVDIPEAAAAYFSAASKIDQHNRCRQDALGIEKAFEVKEWS